MAKQKAVEACVIKVETYNVAFGVNAPCRGAKGIGDVDVDERALAKQKAMATRARYRAAWAYGGRIVPYDVTFGVNPICRRVRCTGKSTVVNAPLLNRKPCKPVPLHKVGTGP